MRIESSWKYRDRLRANLFTVAEILIIPKAQGLVISPVAAPCGTLLHLPERPFPAVHGIAVVIVQAAVMHKASARKAHELWLHLLQRLGNVLPQTALLSEKRVLRKKGDHVKITRSSCLKSQRQPPTGCCLRRLHLQFIPFPLPAADCKRSLRTDCPSFLHCHAHMDTALDASRVHGEIISFSIFHKKARIISRIADRTAGL